MICTLYWPIVPKSCQCEYKSCRIGISAVGRYKARGAGYENWGARKKRLKSRKRMKGGSLPAEIAVISTVRVVAARLWRKERRGNRPSERRDPVSGSHPLLVNRRGVGEVRDYDLIFGFAFAGVAASKIVCIRLRLSSRVGWGEGGGSNLDDNRITTARLSVSINQPYCQSEIREGELRMGAKRGGGLWGQMCGS